MEAAISGLSCPGGTSVSTMPQTHPAAREKTSRLMRLMPLTSTMLGTMTMSFTPTYPDTSLPATVLTMTLGTPSGKARMAAHATEVPPVPPRESTASKRRSV